jgi:hypothetical protein
VLLQIKRDNKSLKFINDHKTNKPQTGKTYNRKKMLDVVHSSAVSFE